jgi:hypothetical protein
LTFKGRQAAEAVARATMETGKTVGDKIGDLVPDLDEGAGFVKSGESSFTPPSPRQSWPDESGEGAPLHAFH